jgi:tetratricopeptide (TPR) repeat protein
MPHARAVPRLAQALLCAALFTACAGAPRHQVVLRPSAPTDSAALASAVEAFHRANDPAELKAAVERAAAVAPGSGAYHELAADLARLQMREVDEVNHLLAALQDPSLEGAWHALHRLDELPRNRPQQAQWLGLLEALTSAHPSPEVRAHAAFFLAAQLHVLGEHPARDRAVSALGAVLPLTVIGGWDNDQGKGFDQALPPESGVDLGARYEGSLMEIGWSAAPTDVRGVAELREYLAPDRWAVAYAASAFHAPTAGRYELRVSSADPVKVFVNGVPVLEAREVESAWAFDQFVIPLELPAGDHQVLLKSAHRTGNWRLFARVTGEAGAPVAVSLRQAGPVTSTHAGAKVLREEALLDARVAHLGPGSARWNARRAQLAAQLFAGATAVRAAQDAAKAHPGIGHRAALVQALWANAERGRTADELTALDRDAGEALPLIRRMQARFWQQEGLRSRARAALTTLVSTYPERAPAARQLASLFHDEKWLEDECAVYERLDRALPGTWDFQLDLGTCWVREQREDRAIALFEQLLGERPADLGVLARLHHALRERGRLDAAIRVARRAVKAHPQFLWPRLQLAETLRRAGEVEAAMVELAQAKEAFPHAADVRRAEAALAWRLGNAPAAIDAWQAALLRNPEDEATANRLDFVAPAATGPWAADVPEEQAIAAAVAERARLKAMPGADLAWHLDHEVVQLRADGSTINVVTHVVTALNQQGRDKLTRRRLQHGGRQRVLHAWSIDARGRRSEASVRAREVLYRGLEVGSTIVLQYRADSPPSGFLPRYLSRMWFFQAPSEQKTLGEFILWYPAGQNLREHVVGELERQEERRGDELRVTWRKRDVPPLLPEPNMPGPLEVAAHVQLTTVPGWDAYQRWEEALLEGALRDSPELEALAKRLVEGAGSAEEKLLRIHEYVMEEIRYQQDYESFIAGVKPHPASMVVERRYGDCKDKTVLFMTLARKAGLQARFATVRTRDRGQVRRSLPTQQFNHAIVYIPPQQGLAEGRFFDSTADALDLDVLRDDNAGTEALVYDPDARSFDWVPIPWQTPGHHRQFTDISFALKADGSAEGQLSLSGRGRSGGMVRRVTRNPESFKQFIQMAAGSYFAGASADGAEVVEAKDLRSPAEVRTRFTAPNVARVEGETLRLRLPTEWSPKHWFKLAERRHPLVLGTPNELGWRFHIALPEGMQAQRLPSSGEVTTPCLIFRREVRPAPGGLEVDQTLRITCERVAAEEYPAYRVQMEQLSRFLDEELVVGPATRPAGLKKNR